MRTSFLLAIIGAAVAFAGFSGVGHWWAYPLYDAGGLLLAVCVLWWLLRYGLWWPTRRLYR